jgi:exodeoxyribonuclease V gamma subunit
MPLNVYWSDRLEDLADGLFGRWDSGAGKDPFARTCVVVGDMATRNWLQSHFLLRRRPGPRRVLANIEFKPFAEFVNDWLSAQVHGKDGRHRSPSEHPYAKGVLAWRIDAILRDVDPAREADKMFRPLAAYVGGEASARRRFELAERLAQLYDDYLNYRYPMLVRWESPQGGLKGDEEPWQRELYRRLVRQDAGTYAKDYAAVFSENADPAAAFLHGFPRYEAVHVFDVAFAPWPYFEILRRISRVTPVSIWGFSPCPGFWMDVEGKREHVRACVASLRAALEDGAEPPETSLPARGDEADRALLGALALGARGALLSQVDISEGDCLWLGADGAAPVEDLDGESPFSSLREVAAELHVCHSPRRELEALRNGIYTYLAEHSEARPGDVLVLCGDWAAYAPLAEAVFAAEPDERLRIPVKMEGLAAEETPLVHSFGDVLAFRENRFEVNAVFNLLGVAEIREKFGISAEDVDVLKDMVGSANIHWGYDDDDVRSTLGLRESDVSAPFAYTWRRGLDRLELDALMGPRPNPDVLVAAGKIGALLPCGEVEADRARLVACLDAFVRRLNDLRNGLRGSRSAEDWQRILTTLVDDMYAASGENLDELASFREAIASTAQCARNAREAGGDVGAPHEIEADVFLTAVADAVRGTAPRRPSAGDAVRFAPLKNASATTADFVWICGLNDGRFPRDGMRPSFDQIGRHPTPYDASLREWDAFALLKAALGARKTLALSYVGWNIRSNEKVPPAVPLADLLDWFDRNRPGQLIRYDHPLQPYSARYFYACGGDPLPPNHSAVDRAAAAILAGRGGVQRGTEEPQGALQAFKFALEGDTVVELDELIRFFSKPNTFLRSRLKVWTDDAAGGELDDDEVIGGVHLRTAERTRLKLDGESGMMPGAVFVERGRSEDEKSVLDAEEEILNGADRDKILRRPMRLQTPPENYCSNDVKALDMLKRMDGAEAERIALSCKVDEKAVTVVGMLKLVEDHGTNHRMTYSEYGAEFGLGEAELLLHHLLGHAAGKKFLSVAMYGDGKLKGLLPMAKDEARAKLDHLLALAFGPLPEGMPNLAVDWVEDALPEDMCDAVLDGMEFIKSARLPRA